jgi:hypothetical protein
MVPTHTVIVLKGIILCQISSVESSDNLIRLVTSTCGLRRRRRSVGRFLVHTYTRAGSLRKQIENQHHNMPFITVDTQ